MTKEEELDQLRAEKAVWCEALRRKDEEVHQLQQEKQILREGFKEAIQAIGAQQERIKALEGLIESQQEHIKTLERQQAKDSHKGQSVPYARASQLLHELLGVQLSAGSIATFVKTCHQQLAEVETSLKAALVKTKVIHQDETGLRVGKMGWWVHVCSTDRLTYYAAHPSRGRAALDAIGIAPQFGGTSVHDGLVSYQGYCFTQALCNVHHLRELTFVEEELKQPWARKMKELLLDMKAEVERAKALGQHELDVLVLTRFYRRYDEILTEGYLANPPPPPPQKRTPGRPKQGPARNLLDRLSQRKWAVLRFLHDFAVPFDNNQAERDLRMIKVQQKVSGCFRTEGGVAMFCRIRSYLSTLRKQGIELLAALHRTFSGHPVLPAFA